MVKCKVCIRSIKNNKVCFIHENVKCCICQDALLLHRRINLKNCRHLFCKSCLGDSIYTNQHFNGFSTNDCISCPVCNVNLSDIDWSTIMEYLVNVGKLQREVIYAYYLNKQWATQLQDFVQFDREYDVTERNTIEDDWEEKTGTFLWKLIEPDDEPEIVYFLKVNDFFTIQRNNFYIFKIDYQVIKQQNSAFFKELVEYVFHPQRIKRLGGMEYLSMI